MTEVTMVEIAMTDVTMVSRISLVWIVVRWYKKVSVFEQ